MDLERFIRDVPNFPKPGILFKDITTLLQEPAAFKETVTRLLAPYQGQKIDKIVAVESRGFIFAAPMALELKCGFVPARKSGKLPAKTIRCDYALEYGQASLELHADAIGSGDRVIIVDDLLATGGTVQAVASLVEKLGGRIVGIDFVVELDFLKGREKLAAYPVHSLLHY